MPHPGAVPYQTRTLRDIQLESHGRIHPGCLPPAHAPCHVCNISRNHPRPDPYWLDAASLPEHVDIFRLDEASVPIIANEHLVEAVRRLELDGVVFKDLKAR